CRACSTARRSTPAAPRRSLGSRYGGTRVQGPKPEPTNWEAWMRGMGRYTRRLRELTGLSQEQLARLAGVSQGAVSRMEGGRAVNTPMIVVMRVNAAMRRALAQLPPGTLSEESRRLMDVPSRGVPD